MGSVAHGWLHLIVHVGNACRKTGKQGGNVVGKRSKFFLSLNHCKSAIDCSILLKFVYDCVVGLQRLQNDGKLQPWNPWWGWPKIFNLRISITQLWIAWFRLNCMWVQSGVHGCSDGNPLTRYHKIQVGSTPNFPSCNCCNSAADCLI